MTLTHDLTGGWQMQRADLLQPGNLIRYAGDEAILLDVRHEPDVTTVLMHVVGTDRVATFTTGAEMLVEHWPLAVGRLDPAPLMQTDDDGVEFDRYVLVLNPVDDRTTATEVYGGSGPLRVAEVQETVGGYFEVHSRNGFDLYVEEMPDRKTALVNALASRIVGTMILGPAVVTVRGDDGDSFGLTPVELQMFADLYDLRMGAV